MIDYLVYHARQLPILSVVCYLLVVNLLTFLTYRYDKRAAIDRRWRIPESTLHMLMFCGGTIGAFIAQRRLRHKNRKQSFQVVFWILCVIQCMILMLLLFR